MSTIVNPSGFRSGRESRLISCAVGPVDGSVAQPASRIADRAEATRSRDVIWADGKAFRSLEPRAAKGLRMKQIASAIAWMAQALAEPMKGINYRNQAALS